MKPLWKFHTLTLAIGVLRELSIEEGGIIFVGSRTIRDAPRADRCVSCPGIHDPGVDNPTGLPAAIADSVGLTYGS